MLGAPARSGGPDQNQRQTAQTRFAAYGVGELHGVHVHAVLVREHDVECLIALCGGDQSGKGLGSGGGVLRHDAPAVKVGAERLQLRCVGP